MAGGALARVGGGNLDVATLIVDSASALDLMPGDVVHEGIVIGSDMSAASASLVQGSGDLVGLTLLNDTSYLTIEEGSLLSLSFDVGSASGGLGLPLGQPAARWRPRDRYSDAQCCREAGLEPRQPDNRL